MQVDDISALAASLDGVRHRVQGGLSEWRYRGRLVARIVEEGKLVIRCDFEYRDRLLRTVPGTFSVPPRYQRHMKIVADLVHGEVGAIEGAVEAAWVLQRSLER